MDATIKQLEVLQKMIRLDKYLTMCGVESRSVAKKCIRRGYVTVNDIEIRDDDVKIDENHDRVVFDGEPLTFKKNIYIVMNKPQDCICTTEEEEGHGQIVSDYLDDFLRSRELFTIGRLDKDTEGLLLLTDDGDFCHKVISPKKHVPKKYYAEIVGQISDKEIAVLSKGVKIGDYTTLPAVIKRVGEQALEITINEGKYHQIKLMLESIGNRVTFLKRISIGNFILPELEPGEYREMTVEELNMVLGK